MEEVSESERMEEIPESDDDGARTDPEKYSVCIVDDLNFTDVDVASRERRAPFETWWPSTAKQIIAAVYGEEHARKGAARALSALVHSERTHVTASRMSTDDVNALHELYSSRLMCHEQYLVKLNRAWCDRITRTVRQCREVIDHHAAAKAALMRSVQRVLAAERKHGEQSRRISREIFRRHVQDLETKKYLRLRIIRAEAAATAVDAIPPPPTKELDERIRSVASSLASRGVSSQVLKNVEATYRQHLANVEHDLVAHIKRECHAHWLPALRSAAAS